MANHPWKAIALNGLENTVRRNVRLVTALIAVVICTVGTAATQRTERLSITSYSSLADVIQALEEKYGWLITYECPPFDLVPVELTHGIEYQVNPVTGAPLEAPEAILSRAIQSYEAATGYNFNVTRAGPR